MHEDDPDALESMFEFTYMNDFTLPHEDPHHHSMKEENLLHCIKVLVVGDKYMAEVLKNCALENFDCFFDENENYNNRIVLLGVAANHVYHDTSIFGPVYNEPTAEADTETKSDTTLEKYEEEG